MSDVLVVIPTYNEKDNLAELVQLLMIAVDVDVLVVDDNSPDGTGAIADMLAGADPRIHVLHRGTKSGLGDAYRAGFVWGLERGYGHFVEMDGDGSHQPHELALLLRASANADVVLGSRWVTGGRAVAWPARRTLLSKAGSLYARIALGLPYRDITGGFRVYSGDALRSIGFDRSASDGYAFQIEMLWNAHLRGLRVIELPITFIERRFGASKMSVGIVVEAVRRVTAWGFAALPDRLSGRRTAETPVRGPVRAQVR